MESILNMFGTLFDKLVANPCYAQNFRATEISGYCSFATAFTVQLLILRSQNLNYSWWGSDSWMQSNLPGALCILKTV